MIRVAIAWHKDGDFLTVQKMPWWIDIYEWFVWRLLCPCCGVTGWLSGKWEWYGIKTYDLANKTLGVTFKRTKTLYEVPIPSGCEAEKAIYGKHEMCWNDDCPVRQAEASVAQR